MSKTSFRLIGTAISAIALITTTVPASAQPRPQQHEQSRPGQNTAQPDRGGSERRDERANRYRVTSTVNLRSGPGTNHRRIGQIRAGRTVEVDQTRSGWLHIRGEGWISAQFARRA